MFKEHRRYEHKKLSIFDDKAKFIIFYLIWVTEFEKLGHKGPTAYKKRNQNDLHLKRIGHKITFHIV